MDTEPDLTVLWTGSIHGYIEPCGCVAGQIGGVDRIAHYVEEERERNPDALWIETGDLLLERHELLPPVLEQLPIKAEALFRVWGETGCDAYALGDAELVLGAEAIQELAAEHDVPVLCANLVDEAGELVFEPSRVIERGGYKIGIFSILAAKLDLPVVGERGKIDVAALAAEQGLSILPWREIALEQAAELKAQGCDLIFAATHIGFLRNKLLAELVPDVDAVFGPHFEGASEEQQFVGNTPVLVAYVRGARVGRLEYWWPEPEDYFLDEGHGPLSDISAQLGLELSARVALDEYENLVGREEALGSEEWELKRNDHLAQHRVFLQERESMGALPSGNRFSHLQVPMHFGVRRSEVAMRSIDQYHSDLDAYWTALQEQHGPMEERSFVSPTECQECHPAQYEFWRATRHSRAFSTLEATQQEMDAECIGCHTAGYRQEGGFFRPHRHEGFENVQCGSCHGPAAEHVRGGASYVRRGVLRSGQLTCMGCHDKDHDPDFEKEAAARMLLVTCPPLEPAGRGAPALLEAYREAARFKQRRQRVPWGDIGILYWKAGAAEESLQAGFDWIEAEPDSREALNFTGQRLLDMGREEDALPLFQQLVQMDPTHSEPLVGLSAALRPVDPRAALLAALEAWSLQPGHPALRAICMSHLAARDCGAARAALDDYLDARPHETELLSDVRAEIQRVCLSGG